MEGIGLLADSNGLWKPAGKEAVDDVGDPHWNEELGPEDARLFRPWPLVLTTSLRTGPTSNALPRRPVRHMAAPTRAFKRNECETDTIDLFSDSRLGGMCPYSAIHVRGASSPSEDRR